jgi:hypothetical protein
MRKDIPNFVRLCLDCPPVRDAAEGRKTFKSKFLAASSILVPAMSAPAFARQADQSQAGNNGAAEQIIVTVAHRDRWL